MTFVYVLHYNINLPDRVKLRTSYIGLPMLSIGKILKGCVSVCSVPISPKSVNAPRSMDSVKECPPQTDARFWPAVAPRVAKSSPCNKGRQSLKFRKTEEQHCITPSQLRKTMNFAAFTLGDVAWCCHLWWFMFGQMGRSKTE